ncbi:peptidase S1 and S6, chymotrypsin/Hap [Chondromyces apiculatus DSM 436]|uniref:Peptidase S1 and S6, chymotrypsin/Hap n=1 Tax=Chondromyces apiculatus DSM 436 TaxID=1192034 RepID=A0A017T7A9_9BACT|nr:peptidase S1 and S6, chymotrypsin/Hap [Chondromyces apiculatus DSM 436]
MAAAACASGTTIDSGPREPTLCDLRCDCEGCTADEYDECAEDEALLQEAIDENECQDEFEAFFTCYTGAAVCEDETIEVPNSCVPELGELNQCVTPEPACSTLSDGICDEPEGTGTCPEGSDAVDCATPTTCATTNNGVCDEPEGTATCSEGTDVADCTPTGTCNYTNDGYCDEPEGSGLCPEGTDVNDCMPTATCPYTNDGECDEPEGTGLCPEGSDPGDCL